MRVRVFQLLVGSPCTGSSPRSLLICDQRSQTRSGPLTPVRLCASLRSNYWRTLRVRAPRPVHYSSVTNDLNRVRAPLHPSAHTLGYRISLASAPLPAQPLDGLSAFGPLISYAIPSISRPPLRLRATQL